MTTIRQEEQRAEKLLSSAGRRRDCHGSGRPNPWIDDGPSASLTRYLGHFLYLIGRSRAVFEPGDVLEVATLAIIMLLYLARLVPLGPPGNNTVTGLCPYRVLC